MNRLPKDMDYKDLILYLYTHYDVDGRLLVYDYRLIYCVWLIKIHGVAPEILFKNWGTYNSQTWYMVFTKDMLEGRVPIKGIERAARKVREDNPHFRLNRDEKIAKYAKIWARNPELFAVSPHIANPQLTLF